MPRTFLLLLGALLLSGCFGDNAPPPYTGTDAAPASTSAMFRGDLARTGVHDTEPLRDLTGVKWRYHTQGPVLSSPVWHDGTLYVGSNSGNLYAINASNGQPRWLFATHGGITSSPAIADGYLYIGSKDGHLYQLDLATGRERARFDANSEIASSPVVHNGTVYVGASSGRLHAIDVYTMRSLWSYRSDGAILSSPTIAEGKVFFGSNDHDLYALHATTGAKAWNFTTDDHVFSTAAYADGVVYFGGVDGFFGAHRASDGAELWNYFLGIGTDEIRASPTVHDDHAYFGALNARFYGVNLTDRAHTWIAEAQGGILLSSAAYAQGMLYFGAMDHHVYAIDAATGEQRWAYRTNDEVHSSPWVQDGVVYIGSSDGYVYALH